MKVADFNKIYEYAKTVDVLNDGWFNTMGWFWLQLTDRQLKKMYNLLLEQGAQETEQAGKAGIEIGALFIYKQD